MNNEKREWDLYFLVIGFIFLIGSFILNLIDNTLAFIGLCSAIIGSVLIAVSLIIKKIGDINETDIVERNKKIIEKNKIDMSEWFDVINRKHKVNTDYVVSMRKKVYSIYILQKYHYWIKDKKLYLFPQKEDFIYLNVNTENSVDYCEENAKLISINISDIIYFKIIGDISYVTNVESTGINLKGAAIGAVAAGDAGAIIGSRPQIKSQVEEKDNRFVELKYEDDGIIKTLEFDYTSFEVFRNIFPEKEYEYVEYKGKNLVGEKENDIIENSTLEERFEKLKSLKNAGLITEEEFSDKKKELLKQI